MENVVAVFIPIITVLVVGLIIITYFYYRSRERQMLIEKGLSAEDIKQFFERKKDRFMMLKIGIISIAFGLGLGIGMMLEQSTRGEHWIPLFLFTFTGIGFVVANVTGNKLREKLPAGE